MKVKEVMQKNVVSVKPSDTVLQALTLLFKMRISGLPVIDAEGKLAGMFTEKELLAYILPSYVAQVGSFVYEENPKSIKKKFLRLDKIKVAEIMRREVVTTAEEVTLCEVAKDMLTQRARRVPVLNKALEVTGIISRGDILMALAKDAETAAENV